MLNCSMTSGEAPSLSETRVFHEYSEWMNWVLVRAKLM